MQKLRTLSTNISSIRQTWFQKSPTTDTENGNEKGNAANDATNSADVHNRVLHENDESRLNDSEGRTLTSERVNETPDTLTSQELREREGEEGGVNMKRATRTRRNMIILTSLFYLLSVIFLILTISGNTHIKPVLRSTYFFQINISNIIPSSSGNAVFTNSLARSLGLHDFYQVGLFNFCEGYDDTGLTSCSHPTPTYWFNPITIILSELLPDATITIPAQVVSILSLVKTASNIMSAFFITGCVMNAVATLITPIVILSRWWSFPITLFTFVAALFTTAASIVATVMFTIFRNTFTSQAGLNITASLGKQMLVFMWLGSAFSVVAWCVNVGMCCCCASERDVRTGRRSGSKEAWPGGRVPRGVGSKEVGSVRDRWMGVGVVRRVPEMTRRIPTAFRRRKGDD